MTFSIFRKTGRALLSTSSKNDDVGLTQEQFLKLDFVQGMPTVDAPLPWGTGAKVGGLVLAGGKGKNVIVGTFDKVAEMLEAFRKNVRFGVMHVDVLVKGFHLHFDNIWKSLELGLIPLKNAGIGLIEVGKKVGTAKQVEEAVSLFNKAMNSAVFRGELLVRLKAQQQSLLDVYRGTKSAQQAVDKAHEINYLIKAIEKFK